MFLDTIEPRSKAPEAVNGGDRQLSRNYSPRSDMWRRAHDACTRYLVVAMRLAKASVRAEVIYWREADGLPGLPGYYRLGKPLLSLRSVQAVTCPSHIFLILVVYREAALAGRN